MKERHSGRRHSGRERSQSEGGNIQGGRGVRVKEETFREGEESR